MAGVLYIADHFSTTSVNMQITPCWYAQGPNMKISLPGSTLAKVKKWYELLHE